MKYINKQYKKLLILSSVLLTMSSCDDLFEPALQNNRDLEEMYVEANYAHGILLNGYTRIPTNSWSFNDVATDDAVSNDRNNGYLKIATGQWTANNNPLDQWRNSKAAIQYVNILLAEADKVKWSENEDLNKMFNDRMKGEAYALRALHMFYLLQAHSGITDNGTLLGVPILTEPEKTTSNYNLPRNTFEECMQQLYADVAKAEELLPLDFEDVASDNQVPSKYDGVNRNDYNRVFGQYGRLKITARIAKAIRAKAALMASSPAYQTGSTTTWENAANYTYQVLNLNNGINGIDANGVTWYANTTEITNLAEGVNPKEILWRTNAANSRDLEQAHFPPTLYGSGRLNPTQNLVDAFPTLTGYPINNSVSGYNATTPYVNRDPRLLKYILVNGATAGVSNTVINTSADGTTNDGINKVETSTRTGYYMRKLLRQDVSNNPVSPNEQRHYKPHIRYTEMYLTYAEAANEAWGPMGTGGNSFSAYDVIKAIRKRAGIGLTNGDAYLEEIKNDKDKMRALIRNERRLELCFEGFRFWDLRRWKESLNEVAKGMSITAGNFEVINVENRIYQTTMIYGPIPYSEILKYNSLQQNTGW